MNYYERHLGDYARDTAHLSLLEHGVYTILLDRFYATEQGIPADQIHRLARARTDEERAAVDMVLAEFFVLRDGLYVNERAEREIVKAQARINAARENGRSGGRPRKNPERTDRKPAGFSGETQSKALQTPSTSLGSEAKASGAAAPEVPQLAASGEPVHPDSLDKALFAEGRKVFGDSAGGLLNKAIRAKGKPWLVQMIETCRSKDPQAARAYMSAAMTEREQRVNRFNTA